MRRAAILLPPLAAAVLAACGRSPAPQGDSASPPAASSPAVPSPSAVAAGRGTPDFLRERDRLRDGEWAVLRRPAAVERGALGGWDDFRVASPVVVREGAQYRMWYLGCHLALRDYACGVGHATSGDGLSWSKHGRPVLAVDDPIDRGNVEALAVVHAQNRYWLWYGVPVDWFNGRRRPALHLATSPDGLAWHEEGVVFEGDPDGTFAIDHSVFHDGTRFHLWYVTNMGGGGSPLLRHFESADGRAWTEAGATEIWQLRRYMDQPGRLLVRKGSDGRLHALFTYGSEASLRGVVGELVSEDGTTWQMAAARTAAPLLALMRDDRVRVSDLTGVTESGGLAVWMTVEPEDGAARINGAFLKGFPQ